DEERQVEPPRRQVLHQLVQVEAAVPIRIGADLHVSPRVHGEVRLPPALRLVEPGATLRGPGPVRFRGLRAIRRPILNVAVPTALVQREGLLRDGVVTRGGDRLRAPAGGALPRTTRASTNNS